jgi:hypothetical protein
MLPLPLGNKVMRNRLQRYWEQQERTQRLKRLCRGLHAEFRDGSLIVTKDGQPFKEFTIGASLDWKSGQFSLYNELVFRWERTERTNGPTKGIKHCWAYYAPLIVEMINTNAKHAESQTHT